MTTLLAYHNDPKIKANIMAQLQAHHDADEIVQGVYWTNGKGCAVGCIAETEENPHEACAEKCGGPLMLYILIDAVFEGLPNIKARAFPLKVMGAIEPGADLSRVGWKFQHWLLTDVTVNPGINHPLVKDAVKQCADALVPLTEGKPVDEYMMRAAALEAWSAENAARGVAGRAEVSAASAAKSAAWSASYELMADKLIDLIGEA